MSKSVLQATDSWPAEKAENSRVLKQRVTVSKITTAEGVERLEENKTEKLSASNIPRLSAEELFRLAAQLEVRSTESDETSPPGTIFYPYVE